MAEAQDFLYRPIPTRKNNESGQASIEFLLTFSFGIGFTILFLGLALNMTKGYLVHYANFMASRTYLSHDIAATESLESALNQAEKMAEETFKSYPLGAFDIAVDLKVNSPLEVPALMSGTTATFMERLTPFSLVGGDSEAVFHSESFLTKEPPRLQCLRSVCQAMGLSNCTNVLDITAFDNGC